MTSRIEVVQCWTGWTCRLVVELGQDHQLVVARGFGRNEESAVEDMLNGLRERARRS